jgi:SAM-dependent methyltransferase
MAIADTLKFHGSIWKRKPVVRIIYDDFYDRISRFARPGLAIEIGGGIGNFKSRLVNVVSTDVQFAPWLDCVADAHQLPFADGTTANIVMVDVLHHIEFPSRFFREAERIMRPGGRLIMVEPAITWGSTFFYRFMHQEPVDMSADPLADGIPDPRRNPYDSNQAIPTLIATREKERFLRLFPNFRISHVVYFSLVAYPLSGGFKPWSLIAVRLVKPVLTVEHLIEPVLGRWFAFRMLLVIDKIASS